MTLGDDEPFYIQIARRLEALIRSGALPPDTTLPSERRLAVLMGVSRITVQHSYNELRRKSLVTSHGRRGSVVADMQSRIQSPMNRLRGFTEEMREMGRVPSSKVLERRVVENRRIAAIMGQRPGDKLLKVRRVRYADGLPMSNETAWYNLRAAPFLVKEDLSGSIYTVLENNGMALTHCEQVIEAVHCTAEDAEIFGFVSPTPCVLIKRRSFTAKEKMMEYVEGTFRGDVYSYRMRLNS
ncbi:MAG: GntR family transcriptional regulator [Sphingobium sp.]|nr:GntR family transcriptional regulator [Sphingobium sp.]